MTIESFMAVIGYTVTIFSIGYRVGSYISAKK